MVRIGFFFRNNVQIYILPDEGCINNLNRIGLDYTDVSGGKILSD
ncbi:MAG TPA: hypothetical protein VJ203_04625 [Bacteroidales bacterium]|nr:hypothetical protein [Bacteroidales bacterium]